MPDRGTNGWAVSGLQVESTAAPEGGTTGRKVFRWAGARG